MRENGAKETLRRLEALKSGAFATLVLLMALLGFTLALLLAMAVNHG